MIRFKNIESANGKIGDVDLPSNRVVAHLEIDGSDLLLLPSLIDPHVHFRFPGEAYKETWESAARAAFASGITHVFDMPNNHPPCTTVASLQEKRKHIEKQLEDAHLPLTFGLYLGATHAHLSEISKAKKDAIGVKIFMGGSTGTLLLDDPKDQEEAFKRASDVDLVVAVHAEAEHILKRSLNQIGEQSNPRLHSSARDRRAASVAVEHAINLAQDCNTKLYILHVSTKEEVKLIREAKAAGISLLAEASPHHLFFTEEAYDKLGTKVQVNPPIRTQEDVDALWEGISDRTIDTIGSDHAPHTLAEKAQSYGKAPSGIAGIEILLPFLLDQVAKGKLDIGRLIELTRNNIANFFNIDAPNDWVIVNMKEKKEIRDEELKTKCGFTPYHGLKFQGVPKYLLVQGQLFNLQEKDRKRG